MEITRIEKGAYVKESLIDGRTKVKDLPKGLRIRVVKLLNKLRGVTLIITFTDKNRHFDAVINHSGRNYTLNDLPIKEIKKEFIETIGLLEWFFKEHWHSFSPRNVCAPLRCLDCGKVVPPGHTGPCPNDGCLSHSKWRKVIGPSYKIPKSTAEKIIAFG